MNKGTFLRPALRRVGLVALVGLLLLAAALVALAADGYELAWWSVDGGGGTFSAGGTYALGGTVGQPDAGLLTGGTYTLGGGFWGGGAVTAQYRLYLPLTLRNYSGG